MPQDPIDSNPDPRAAVIHTANALGEHDLNQGTAGNVSMRIDKGLLITPTGVPYAALTRAMIVAMAQDGSIAPGSLKPSSEWRIHRDIYRARSDIHAIVHVHSPYATALACARREIPAFHYMIAVAGGDSVRCAPYATFGTQTLSDHTLVALAERRACLLANHGQIATGVTLDAALTLAREVESLARQYCLALQVGGPTLLTTKEMHEALALFEHYGKQA